MSKYKEAGFLSLIIFLTSSAVSAQNAPLFHFAMSPGHHPVGLKVVEQYDYSRSYRSKTDDLGKRYPGERARPLQTLIWYPAKNNGSKPMTVGDYANLTATETSFGIPQMSHSGKQWLDGMKPTLSNPLWAVRDAPLAPGRFPVVIYAPSFSAMAWENADLCEYLASHGYVVIASPSMGENSRAMTPDLIGINAQARDISFLIGYAKTLPDTDMSELAVAGFSWGGISNLFAAARDNRIGALVALDGSMRYFPGLVKQAGDVHPEGMTIPLLFFAQGELSLEDQARYMTDAAKNQGPSVLNTWTHGDLITVHMLGLVHTEFSSMFQRNENVWDIPESKRADYDREDGIAGYGWVARYTLEFVNASLKHDAAAMTYLQKTAAENGGPLHFMTVAYRAATDMPASFDTFRAKLGLRGFERAAEVYAEMQKSDHDFKLDESSVNSWAYNLMSDHHLPEAIDVLKLNVQIYPESSDALASLGEAYMESGIKQSAIDSYKKSLEKDPLNFEAKQKLKKLENSAPTSTVPP